MKSGAGATVCRVFQRVSQAVYELGSAHIIFADATGQAAIELESYEYGQFESDLLHRWMSRSRQTFINPCC